VTSAAAPLPAAFLHPVLAPFRAGGRANKTASWPRDRGPSEEATRQSRNTELAANRRQAQIAIVGRGARYNRTSPQPPVLFCFGLFWSTHKTDAFCLFCRPLLFLGGRRRRGRGREGPPAAGLASFGGPRQNPRRGPRKKSRKYQRSRLQQNICSARRSEPRDLWPNAQPAPRLHRRTSFCLREQAVSTLYVPRRGSALCSTPAASWLPRSRTRPSRQRRCICSTY
jgi:hypothetical protein